MLLDLDVDNLLVDVPGRARVLEVGGAEPAGGEVENVGGGAVNAV